ncbi:MAG: hypothetical protein JJ916_07180 [Phycisphaerales bacterium]|nr:hypothetical protein [Phycisphaerales bacterium]
MITNTSELAPPRCTHCLYNTMGMRVGENCPECGTQLVRPQLSDTARTLILFSQIFTWCGIAFSLMTGALIVVGFLPFTIPLMLLFHLVGFVCALMARDRLKRDHFYQGRPRRQLQLGYASPIILLGFFTLFIGADLLLALVYSL